MHVLFSFLLFLLPLLSDSNASELTAIEKFKEKWRPSIEKLIGESWANKILGEKDIGLPPIPIIRQDAKNVIRDIPEKSNIKNLTPALEQQYNQAYVEEVYKASRRVDAPEGEVMKFLNVLGQGGTREGVYRAIVLDRAYADLENQNISPSERVRSFVKDYMNKYLSLDVSEDSLKKLNFYSIKKITVEKTLELIDAFLQEGKEEDLFSWYSILSSDFATHYPDAIKGKLRSITDKKIHKKWATSVPYQHLKSEAIVKLHLVMNSLD